MLKETRDSPSPILSIDSIYRCAKKQKHRIFICQKISSTGSTPQKLRFIFPQYSYVYDVLAANNDTIEIHMFSLLPKSLGETSLNDHFFSWREEIDEEKYILATEVFFSETRKPQLVHCLDKSSYASLLNNDVFNELMLDFLEDAFNQMRIYFESKFLYENIEDFKIESMGGMCPYQAEGTINGYNFYFRYRGGSASLRIGEPEILITRPHWEAYLDSNDDLGGSLTSEEFVYLFAILLSKLEKASIPFTFLIKPEANYGYPHTVPELEAAQLFAEKNRRIAIMVQLEQKTEQEIFEWVKELHNKKELGRISLYAHTLEEALGLVEKKYFINKQDLEIVEEDDRVFPDENINFSTNSFPTQPKGIAEKFYLW
jgi:hypothetical protein